MSKENDNPIVYSTEKGRMCPGCGEAIGDCVCGADESIAEGDGVVRVSRRTKGRGGKVVTVITGIPVAKSELKKLARELKARCGTGGTVKDDAIEIQGDKRNEALEVLKAKGYTVKLAGG